MNNIQKALENGQSIWLDSISRDMLWSGELQEFVDLGVTGVTSNPAIFDKALAESDIYDEALEEYAKDGANRQTVFERLAVDDIRDAADVLRPVYDNAGRRDGFVSIEVSPTLANDADGTITEARRLWEAIDRPNVMIKVPGTPAGVPAIKTLISEGINVNVTLLFSLSAYEAAANAYVEGLSEFAQASRGIPSTVASVASFFVSRVDTSVDNALPKGHELRGKIGIANAKLAYAKFGELFDRNLGGGGSFFPLHTTGAQVQRPLWASTGVKNPAYSDTMYVDGLMGPDTVNTVPEATMAAYSDHGNPGSDLTGGLDEARAQVNALAEEGISLDAITDDLLKAGVAAFADAYESLLGRIDEKLQSLGS
ncbi:MAG: transaldolase [Dehalococcoidia bacterium]|jgi:transaldolase|nr:transaldolase [Chloroflexota bacterium]MDP6057019.1 transaldolase [Dehalococcoidia bacterium]MDP7090814.1 transaldolase [Dehalococcoidia bacterium]MDP7261111.1 transaldolase [Dehalococcoidia bacterium]MDP7486359.1 transaldolase [Dehalococcoidia bacterium]|tara:strand:+ start:3651 stop:4754 length:1104 start_codon:yes stop_codon:yes gene_type:complete